MSGLTTFAILGLGHLGSCVLAALLNAPNAKQLGIKVRVLTRPGSEHRGPYPSNVSFHPIDYRDPEKALFDLVEALSGVHCVISTVGSGVADPVAEMKRLMAAGKHCGYIPGYANQALVANAARRAGCYLFVPAEYGSPTHTLEPNGPSFIRGKKLFHLDLLNMRLPFLLFYTGKFVDPDPPRSPLPPNTLEMGDAPYPTTRHHAAVFLVQLLVAVPLRHLQGGIFMIRGARREALEAGRWRQIEYPSQQDQLSAKLRALSVSK